jgi:hypothetical protein
VVRVRNGHIKIQEPYQACKLTILATSKTLLVVLKVTSFFQESHSHSAKKTPFRKILPFSKV